MDVGAVSFMATHFTHDCLSADIAVYICCVHGFVERCDWRIDVLRTMLPNQSPEPTAVGAAVAIHAASRRWLSFFR